MSLVPALKILSLAILPFLFAMFAWFKNIFGFFTLNSLPYCHAANHSLMNFYCPIRILAALLIVER